MKITVRQLKQLIREQVEEMAMSEGRPGGGADKLDPAVRKKLESIIIDLEALRPGDDPRGMVEPYAGYKIGGDILDLMDKDASGMIENLKYSNYEYSNALDYLNGGTADISDARFVLKALKTTVKQLKQPTGGGADKLVPAVRNELKSIIRDLGGVRRDDVSDTGLQIGNDILSLMDKDASGMIEDLRDDPDFSEALDYLSGGTAEMGHAKLILKALKTLFRN
jgi:hypothetical protein